jgi:hypothetical protein
MSFSPDFKAWFGLNKNGWTPDLNDGDPLLTQPDFAYLRISRFMMV